MPTEVRRLIFDESEMKAILSAYISTTDAGIPPGMVMDAQVVREDPFALRAMIQCRDGRQIAHVFDEAATAAAIINFCMNSRIPLSRKARKSVKRLNAGIALDMVLGGPTPKQPSPTRKESP